MNETDTATVWSATQAGGLPTPEPDAINTIIERGDTAQRISEKARSMAVQFAIAAARAARFRQKYKTKTTTSPTLKKNKLKARKKAQRRNRV